MNWLKRVVNFNLPGTPYFWAQAHKWLTLMWMVLMVPSVLWWGEMVKWVVIMSVWANIAGHWSAHQAAEAQVEAEDG